MDNNMKVALLIDADNISNSDDLEVVLDEITTNFGSIYIKRAYADWSNGKFEHLKKYCLENAINLVTQPQFKDGKNSTDIAMIIDAMDILYSKNDIDTFCIVTGDSDFTKLATRLREEGKKVIGFGYSQNSQKFLIAACDDYRYIDAIRNGASDADLSKSITKLEEIKEFIYSYLSNNDGISQLGGLKSSLKAKYSDFDERNYGFSNFSTFISSFKDFKITANGNRISVSVKSTDSIEKIREFTVGFLNSNSENHLNSVEIQNAIASKFKNFRLKSFGYTTMKSFLKSISEIDTDKDGKYYIKKEI